jgi:hypothetical protein
MHAVQVFSVGLFALECLRLPDFQVRILPDFFSTGKKLQKKGVCDYRTPNPAYHKHASDACMHEWQALHGK